MPRGIYNRAGKANKAKRPYNRTPKNPDEQLIVHHTAVIGNTNNTITVSMTPEQRDEWIAEMKRQRAELQKRVDDYDKNIAILEQDKFKV